MSSLSHLCFGPAAPTPILLNLQSALIADERAMGFVMEALEAAGTEIVRGRFAWRRMLPPNTSPLPDITQPGGWAALTGQQLWLVSSIFPFLLAPVFASPDSLVSMVEVLGNTKGFYLRVASQQVDFSQAGPATGLCHSAHSERSSVATSF